AERRHLPADEARARREPDLGRDPSNASAEQDRVEGEPLERRAGSDANEEILTARRPEASIKLRRGRRRDERRGAAIGRAREHEPIAAREAAGRMEHVDVADAVAGIERT